MTTTAPPLAYRGPQALPSRVLTVDRAADRLTVTWPVLPPWVPWANAGGNFAVAAIHAGALVAEDVLLWRMRWVFAASGNSLSQVVESLAVVSAMLLVGSAYWAIGGILIVRRQRRWGQVPRVLTVTPADLTLDWLGTRRMRRREWPASRVTAIGWRPVAHLFSRRTTVVRVTVRFATGWPLRFTLSSADPTCIDRGRRGLHELLGRTVPGAD